MRRFSLSQYIIFVAVACLSLLYFFYPAGIHHVYLKCMFHQLTGLYCPGCGSQRAIAALLHGHLYRSAGYNLLLVLSLPLFACFALAGMWNRFNRIKVRQTIFYFPVFLKLYLASVILFGLLRNLPFLPFSRLAP